MGITKVRHILAATNTRCGLQRNADRVAAITAQATLDDLKRKREHAKEINIMRGCVASDRSCHGVAIRL